MSCGSLSPISETVEWIIPDFFSLDKPKGEYIDSPRFSMVGNMWHLKMHPKQWDDIFREECFSVYLCRDDLFTDFKTVTFSIGIKTRNDIVEVNEAFETFGEDDCTSGWYNFMKRDSLLSRQSERVPSGSLTLICSVRENLTPERKSDSRSMVMAGLETLSSDFKDLLNSDKRCDVTINVQGKEFRAHRTVLAARSSVFRAMYEQDITKGAYYLLITLLFGWLPFLQLKGVHRIYNCDPESFGDFLHFLYTGRVELDSFDKAYSLYSTAEKYDVQQLKSYCAFYMRQNLTPENFCDVLVLCDHTSDYYLEASARDFFNENSLEIQQTVEWDALMQMNFPLANKCLREWPLFA